MTSMQDARFANMESRQDAAGLFGAIYSYTTVYEAPEGFVGQAPYRLALIRLDDDSLVIAQLTDVDSEVEIGDRVEMVTRKLTTDGDRGMIVYGYKFRPAIK